MDEEHTQGERRDAIPPCHMQYACSDAKCTRVFPTLPPTKVTKVISDTSNHLFSGGSVVRAGFMAVQASINLFRYLNTIERVVDERDESLPTSLERPILADKLAEYLLLWHACQVILAICICSLAGRVLVLMETDLRDPKLSFAPFDTILRCHMLRNALLLWRLQARRSRFRPFQPVMRV